MDMGIWQFHGMEELSPSGLQCLQAAFDSRVGVGVVDKKVKDEAQNEFVSKAPIKVSKKMTKPKARKPWSAFMHFAMENCDLLAKKFGIPKTMKAMAPKVGEAWRKLSPAEKERYVKKAQEDKARWNQEAAKKK